MEHNVKYVELSSLVLEPPRNGLYKSKDFQGRGNRWIKMSEIYGNDFFDNQDTERLEVTKTELSRFSCKKGDLLFGRTSLTLEGVGNCLLVGDIDDEPIFESNLFRVRLNPELADSLFYYYFFKSPYGKQLIQKIAKQTAAASITATDLLTLSVPHMPVKRLRAVSSLIFKFDKKIQLNRQTNQTLEAMAQALFKSWFVDFDPVIDNALAAGHEIPPELQARAEARKSLQARAEQRQASLSGDRSEQESGDILPESIRQLFPNRFVLDAQMGWIPEGWVSKPVSAFGSIVCGKTPSKKNPEFYGADIPFIKIPDTHGKLYIVDTSESLSLQGDSIQPKKRIPANSVCVSCIATVGQVFLTSQESHTNQQINSIIPIDLAYMPYLYFSMIESRKLLHDLASGASVTLNLNTSTFSKIQLLDAGKQVTHAFASLTQPMFDKVLFIEKQILELAELRDTLLPKLISGELRLPDEQQPAKTVTA